VGRHVLEARGIQAVSHDCLLAFFCGFYFHLSLSSFAVMSRIHGHCLVPNRYAHDPSLGAWVSTQRRHYKILTSGEEGVTSPMTPSRAARLASIGFAWQTSDPRHVPWETRFQQLLEYKAQHGTLNDFVFALYFLEFQADSRPLSLSLLNEKGDCVVPIGWKVRESKCSPLSSTLFDNANV
jgi:hypothetical protein